MLVLGPSSIASSDSEDDDDVSDEKLMPAAEPDIPVAGSTAKSGPIRETLIGMETAAGAGAEVGWLMVVEETTIALLTSIGAAAAGAVVGALLEL